MHHQLKFFFDEHFDKQIAKALKSQNVDVETVESTDRKGLDDTEQLAYAYQQRRVMFTADDDYLKLDAQGIPHSGIIYINAEKKKKTPIGKIVRFFLFLNQTTTPEQMLEHVEYFFDVDEW